MSKCETCGKKQFGYLCDGCIHDPSATDKYEPMNNADRIRAMSDEELAVWLEDVVSCLDCPISKECNSGEHCRMWMKKWLKQPAEVDND